MTGRTVLTLGIQGYLLTVVPMVLTLALSPVRYSLSGNELVLQNQLSWQSLPVQDALQLVLQLVTVFASYIIACIVLTRNCAELDTLERSVLFVVIWLLFFLRPFTGISHASAGFACAHIAILMGFISVCSLARNRRDYGSSIVAILFFILSYAYQRKYAVLAFCVIIVYVLSSAFCRLIINPSRSNVLLINEKLPFIIAMCFVLALAYLLFNPLSSFLSSTANSLRYVLADKGALLAFTALCLTTIILLRDEKHPHDSIVALLGSYAAIPCYAVFAAKGFSQPLYMCTIPTMLPLVKLAIGGSHVRPATMPAWIKDCVVLLCCAAILLICEGIFNLDVFLSMWAE